jgi:hypothetical protein
MQTEVIKHIRIIVCQKTAPEQIVDLLGAVVICLICVDAFQTRLQGSCVTEAGFELHPVRTAPYLAGCVAKHRRQYCKSNSRA